MSTSPFLIVTASYGASESELSYTDAGLFRLTYEDGKTNICQHMDALVQQEGERL